MRNMPLVNVSANQPAVMNANMIRQTILGPPFCWRWNRNTTTFTTTVGVQDYNKSTFLDFGFLEKAAVTDAGTPIKSTEIQLASPLGLATETDRPHHVSTQSDDNAGTTTFRLLPVPDAAYTVTLTYQKKAPFFNGVLTQTWDPIPDEFAYIFNHGFAALALLYADDQRFSFFNQKFVSGLLGASEGLTEMQKNIFLSTWLSMTDQGNSSQFRTQQGVQARGV